MDAQSWAPKARGEARRAADGKTMEVAARSGFAARGLIYVLVGVIALRIAFGGDSGRQQADRGGALEELAGRTLGTAMLWIVGAALAGMGVWRLSEAVFGGADAQAGKPSKRVAAVGRCVFYAFLSFSVLSYAVGARGSGSGSSDRGTQDVTGTILRWPGGQWLVGLGGVAVVTAGLWMSTRALRKKFRKELLTGAMSPGARRFTDFFGVVGGTARGVVFAVAGVFAVVAAVRHRPGEAKGMDDTLRSFRDLPAGPWLLAAIALGLAAFGVFSWCNARWRRL
ncbi:DUF1206 domain-containing protein [Streptomyces griseofuscus]|uniref:DUF1206 domain-containing protein n=1 Tax=Streptomyces TaxID=1883 RepID=UPI00159EFECE|nr:MULTISPECIES: DUF1206 domain-containing protein [unclassified Streptomyces]MBJ6998581.1 DUF1206 domain-containing protein [Streptomyces sp. CRPSP2-6A1]